MPYQRQRRGYQAAAITKTTDPARRADAVDLARIVCMDPAGGVRRDWLEHKLCRDERGPRWTYARYNAAMFYGYGMGWLDFAGFTYVIAPAPPGARLAAAAQAPCRAPAEAAPDQGSLISAQPEPR